jgi:hypothetical protein
MLELNSFETIFRGSVLGYESDRNVKAAASVLDRGARSHERAQKLRKRELMLTPYAIHLCGCMGEQRDQGGGDLSTSSHGG